MHWEMYVLTENYSYMKIEWNDLQEYCTNYLEFNLKHMPKLLLMDITKPYCY